MKNHDPPEPVRWCSPLSLGCACSPNVTFSTVLAPACQENHIFPTNFNKSCLSQISSILHRCARVTFPMVWRTRRFVAVKTAIYYQRFLTISLLANMRPSKFLLSPLVLATFSLCIEFLVHRHDPSPSIIVTFFQFLQENQTFFKCFPLSNVKRFFASLATFARDRYQHDVLQGAHVQNS